MHSSWVTSMDATDSLNSTASTISTPRRNVAGSRGGKENCEPRGPLSSEICWDGIQGISVILKTEGAAESGPLVTGVQSPSTERYHSGGSSSSSGHEPSWKLKLCLLERELAQSRRTIRSLAKEVNRRQTRGSTSTLSWHTVPALSGPREEAEVWISSGSSCNGIKEKGDFEIFFVDSKEQSLYFKYQKFIRTGWQYATNLRCQRLSEPVLLPRLASAHS